HCAGARSPLRRRVRLCRAVDGDLLPPVLSQPASATRAGRVLPGPGSSRAGGVPALPPLPAGRGSEIGRASCRERVDISVVAAAIEKKYIAYRTQRVPPRCTEWLVSHW